MAGVSCTNAWETSSVFYQNFDGKGTYEDNIGEISERKRGMIEMCSKLTTLSLFYSIDRIDTNHESHQTPAYRLISCQLTQNV